MRCQGWAGGTALVQGHPAQAQPCQLTSILLYIQLRSFVTRVYTPGLFFWPHPVPQLVTPATYQRPSSSQTRGPPLSPWLGGAEQ